MKELIEKLIGILTEIGLDEPTVDAVVSKLTSEEKPEEGDPAPTPAEEEVPTTETPIPPEEEVPGDVPPSADPSAIDTPVEEGEPVPPTEVPTQPEPQVPAVPQFDPTEILAQVEGVQKENQELKAANEGLANRVAALEEALKTAGVIDGSVKPIEVGDPLPSAAPQSPTDDVFADVLREVNGKRR